METYNVFLDDIRMPKDACHYFPMPEYLYLDWKIVRSHNAFVDLINENFLKGKFPGLVSFDHDLGDDHYGNQEPTEDDYSELEETGYHSAKWLVDFCIASNLEFPKYFVHSMNTVGASNIRNYVENAKEHAGI